MEYVGIVVDDLATAAAFFVELGLKLHGQRCDRHASANTPGIRHVAFAVDDIDASHPLLDQQPEEVCKILDTAQCASRTVQPHHALLRASRHVLDGTCRLPQVMRIP
jgi:hypothetical protein